jgi:hypothetical protein
MTYTEYCNRKADLVERLKATLDSGELAGYEWAEAELREAIELLAMEPPRQDTKFIFDVNHVLPYLR